MNKLLSGKHRTNLRIKKKYKWFMVLRGCRGQKKEATCNDSYKDIPTIMREVITDTTSSKHRNLFLSSFFLCPLNKVALGLVMMTRADFSMLRASLHD